MNFVIVLFINFIKMTILPVTLNVPKPWLLCWVLMAMSLWLQAQETDNKGTSDTTIEVVKVPGPLPAISPLFSTAAVSTVAGETLQKTRTANLSNTLYGRLPGLTVLQGSGKPGYDGASLSIRGLGTYNIPDLVVYVDGFQATYSYFQYLSPAEIESVSILKDAAALATFGMKGANGVLWVTTKRGQARKPQVQLRVGTGIQQPIHINKPLSSYDYARLYNEAISNDNGNVWMPAYTPEQLNGYKNGTGTYVDWYHEALRSAAVLSDADLVVSGGDVSTRYWMTLGYMKNGGLYNAPNDDTHSNGALQRINIRTNLDIDLFSIFEAKVDIGGRIEDRKYPNIRTADLWQNLARYPDNIYPVRNADGSWTGTPTYPGNPVASIRELGYVSTHDRTLQANLLVKEKLDFLIKGLYLKEGVSFNTWTRGSYNDTKNYARYIGSDRQTTDQNTNYTIFDDKGTNQTNWKQFTATAGYEGQFGIHDVSAAVNYLQYAFGVDSNQNGVAGVNSNYVYQNLSGRLHYTLKGRYVGEFGFAYSGSDNYAKGNRWGFYPALSAAWIISKESFWKSGAFDDLKLRASAGKTGYDLYSGGRYLYQQYYSSSGYYNVGNSTPVSLTGLAPSYIANPGIFAERSLKYNIGVDARLFKCLSLTADAFMDKRSGIITPDNLLLSVFGAAPPFENIGKVTSKGWEVALDFSKQVGKWKYVLNGELSYSNNRIDYNAEVPPVSSYSATTGKSINTPLGYRFAGFYDVSDFETGGGLKAGIPAPGFGIVQPGDVRYQDVNGDKKVNEADMVSIGKPSLPRWVYSFNMGVEYAGFDLQLLIQGVAGRDVNLLNTPDQVLAFGNNGNAYSIAEGRWAYYPGEGIDTRAGASYPRLSTLRNTNNYLNSTLWIKNGGFLRLRNAVFGYTIPTAVTRKAKIQTARIYVSGVNLVTWSRLLRSYHIDPETPAGYPAMKGYNVGLIVNFL